MGLLDMLFGQTLNGQQGLLQPGQQPQGILGNPQPATQQPTSSLPNIPLFGGQQNPFGFAMSQLSNVIGGWGRTPEEQAKTAQANATAEAQKAAASTKGTPFGGEGFDNQLVTLRAQEYMRNGIPGPEAYNKAANDVLATKQSYQADPTDNTKLILTPNKGLAPIGASAGPNVAQPGPQAGQIQTLNNPMTGAATISNAVVGADGVMQPPVNLGSGARPKINPASADFYGTGNGEIDKAGLKAAAEAAGRNAADMAANGGVAKTSESQNQAGARSMLVSQGFNNLRKSLDSNNVNPTNFAVGNFAGSMAEKIGGEDAGSYARSQILTPQEQQVNLGYNQAMEGVIGLATGAGVAGAQMAHFKGMLPTPYDPPAVREQKFSDAQNYLQQAIDASGPLGKRVEAIAPAAPQQMIKRFNPKTGKVE